MQESFTVPIRSESMQRFVEEGGRIATVLPIH
jgi:hypothetical protein